MNNNQPVNEAGACVLIKGHRCYRCKHEWRPHDIDAIPMTCPKCKSPFWKTPKHNKKKESQRRSA